MKTTTKEMLAGFHEKLAKATDFGRKGAGDVPDSTVKALMDEMNRICDLDASVPNVFLPEVEGDVRIRTLRGRLRDVHVEMDQLAKARTSGKIGVAPARAYEAREVELRDAEDQLTAAIRKVEAEIESYYDGEDG